jgi:hypothetical protein
MSNDARVTLIFDPFAISAENGQHVSGLNEEREAFTQINDSLRRVELSAIYYSANHPPG